MKYFRNPWVARGLLILMLVMLSGCSTSPNVRPCLLPKEEVQIGEDVSLLQSLQNLLVGFEATF